MVIAVQCFNCIHLGSKNSKGLTCKAFPDIIPEKIIDNKFDHREPYEGDNGIQFEPKR